MTNIFKVKKIRQALLFTVLIMAVYAVGRHLLIPGISLLEGYTGNNSIALLSALTGGSFETFSLFSLGIGPSITASIIVQLLGMDVIPYISNLKDEGTKGRKKLQKITQLLSVVLALLQSYSMIRLFDIQYNVLQDNSVSSYIYIMIIMTAGSMILYWLGNLVTEYGIGDGVSFIILLGILVGMPTTLKNSYNALLSFTESSVTNYVLFAIYVVLLLAITFVVVYISTGIRKINITYGRKLANGDKFTHLPVRVNSASVMPLIFANALITSPLIILSYFNQSLYLTLSEKLSTTEPLGLAILVVLMLIMGIFYVLSSFDPEKISKNLAKNGGYIKGIRPDKETVEYITKTIMNTSLVGIVGLLLLIAVPQIIGWIFKLPSTISFGGTSLVLIVSIVTSILETFDANIKNTKYKEWF